jgi:hypothetical protein
LIILLILVYVLFLTPVLQSTMTLPPSVKIVFSLLLIAPAALVMGMPFTLGIRLLTGTADQEIPWAWGINGCLSVVSTVLATVIALELGFVWVMILAAFVYCMTFLGGGQDCSARKPSGASIPSNHPCLAHAYVIPAVAGIKFPIPGFRIRSGTTAICSFLRRVR